MSKGKGIITELENSVEFSEKLNLTIKDIVKAVNKTFCDYGEKPIVANCDKTELDKYNEKYESLINMILDGYLYLIYTGDKDKVKALAGSGFVKHYINYCKQFNLNPDLISRTIYVKLGVGTSPICIDKLQVHYKGK